MKKLLTTVTFCILALVNSHAKTDTTIVEFNDKALKNNVKIITGNNKVITVPKSLNLNSILKSIGVDSLEREKAFVLISKGSKKQDTLLVVSRDGQKIKIIAKEIAIKKDSINKNQDVVINEPTDNLDKDIERNTVPVNPKSRVNHDRFFSRSDFGFYIGINNFTNKNSMAPNSNYDLRAWQSRFVALSFRHNMTLLRGKQSDLAFSYGPEISWNNFMFENSNIIKYDANNQVSFVAAAKQTSKSKLVLPFVNLPVLFNIGFKDARFKFGIGGYVGYKIGGYSKVKYDGGGQDKQRSSFGAQDFIYGLTTEFGKKNGLTMFFRYNLNDTFKNNQVNAQGLQAFCAGLRI